jgi:hypothetical protein
MYQYHMQIESLAVAAVLLLVATVVNYMANNYKSYDNRSEQVQVLADSMLAMQCCVVQFLQSFNTVCAS